MPFRSPRSRSTPSRWRTTISASSSSSHRERHFFDNDEIASIIFASPDEAARKSILGPLDKQGLLQEHEADAELSTRMRQFLGREKAKTL